VRFEKGNSFSRGRPKGSRNKHPSELADAARGILEEFFERTVEKLLGSKDEAIILDTLKLLADRAYGRALQTAHDASDTRSAAQLFAEIARSPIPPRPTRPDASP